MSPNSERKAASVASVTKKVLIEELHQPDPHLVEQHSKILKMLPNKEILISGLEVHDSNNAGSSITPPENSLVHSGCKNRELLGLSDEHYGTVQWECSLVQESTIKKLVNEALSVVAATAEREDVH